MTTSSELRTLIADIESGPITRELSDRVLLASGIFRVNSNKTIWLNIKTNQIWERDGITTRPHPLRSIDDAVLMVPESLSWGVDTGETSRPSSAHICRLTKRGTRVATATAKWPIICHAETPARALTLAALKARLVQMESGDA